MSMIEKQAKLGRELLELNVDAVRKFAELSSENFRRYMELNQSYAQKLPEVREVGAFVELQRDYGQSLWDGVRDDFKARGDIVRTAVEHTGSLIRGAFGSEPEVAEGQAEAASTRRGRFISPSPSVRDAVTSTALLPERKAPGTRWAVAAGRWTRPARPAAALGRATGIDAVRAPRGSHARTRAPDRRRGRRPGNAHGGAP